MEAPEIIQLFDSFWFEKQVFNQKQTPKPDSTKSNTNADQQTSPKPDLLRVPTVLVRSMSDQLSSSSTNLGSCVFSLSPDSVLVSPKLQTIPSGKEITEEEESNQIQESQLKSKTDSSSIEQNRRRYTRGKKRGTASKSMSELEFDELKGFMDLGFVFSEEDKDSSLVSIIPGLQRLGEDKEGENDEVAVSRPYLSEAWEVSEKEMKKKDELMNWRVPSFSNDVRVKDNLRLWAHTIASTVR